MANPNDNLRRLYQNGLKHFSLPDFDTFQQDMKDEQKRRRFYTNMQEAYSLPDFDTFSQDIGAVAPPAPAQPAAQAQSQPQTTTATVKPITDTTAEQASVQQPVQTSAQPPQPQGWTPTPIQKQFFQFQMEQANARLKKQSEEAQQRMEGIMKGNKPGAFMGEREFNPATGEMETAYYTTQGERVPTSMQQRKANSDYHQWWENNTEAGQRSKEQRLQREFDDRLSRLWDRPERYNAAEQAWSAAESAYNSAVERNRENTNMMVTNFAMNSSDAVAFKQMETVDNFTDRLTTHDLDALMDNAWNNLGEEGQKALIDDCYQMLRYRNPGADGLVLYNQAKEFARQQSDLRMYNLAVEKNLPKSNLEYFMRKIGDMNLVTNIGKGIAVNRVKKTGDMAAYEAANEQYRQDGHKILDVTGMVAGFALDPTTWMSAGVGGAAARGSMWLGGRWLAGRGASAMVTQAATRQFATSMTGRIVGGIAGGAANFGTFEGIKEIENQFAHGGHIVGQDEVGRYINEGYSAGAVGGQALHGLMMGGAVGWLGPVSGNVSDQLVRATSSTLGKVATRAGVYTGATLAEGTIFSVPEWIEGERDAMDVWSDNMAMMVGFKAKHILKSAGGVLGDLKASFDSPTNGQKNRLDFESRLRQRMDAPSDGGLALTDDEKAELKRYGYDLRDLVESAERTGDRAEGSLIAQNAPEIVSRLTDMVADPRVSEAARAKMYYYATGRRLPMSTVMKGEIIEDGNGGFIVESQGANGVITSRSFKSRKAADLELERIKRQTELNTIEIGERYQQTADFENRLQEACRTVAAENGWDMVEVYRTCEEARRNHLRGGDKQFDEVQQNILRKVTDAMGEFEETGATDAMRDRINEKYGVDIDGAIRKEANRRTLQEQTAIDEYLNELIPDKAKEANPVEDAQAEDITNQKLLTDESVSPADSEPVDPRFDNSTDPTPDYDPHQPGGGQAPIGRAVMKYQDRPVEVLSGRVVMMEDGTMIDNERSDASIVIRDLATGKVEMVSPEAILSYEGYEVRYGNWSMHPEEESEQAGVNQTEVEPQSQYTSGQIKIRNSDGTETRGVLTGYVDENGNHEYYVEGDLQHLHYASDHELDNILSEYVPDEPQPSAEQSQAAERVYPEGVNDTEAYDNGLEDGAANTDMSDEKLNSTIARFSDESEVSMLTDYGRGWLEGLKQEQQRRIQAAQSQQPEQTAPIEPTPAPAPAATPEPTATPTTEPAPTPASTEAPQGEVNMPTGVNPVGTIAIPQRDGSTRTFTIGKDAEGQNVVIDDRGFMWAHDGNGNAMQPYSPGANVPTWTDEQLSKLGAVQPANEQPAIVPNQPETVPNSGETPQNPTENAVSTAETVPNPAVPVENVQETSAPTAEPTPLQRIPRDAKGEPIFEQAENPEHGWDALVEFAEGDASTAKEIADTMAEEKRKAYEKAQKQKPKGKTPTEILASKKVISAELVQAEQEYNLWQQMANVEQRRQDAIRSQQEAESRQRAAERAEAEKRIADNQSYLEKVEAATIGDITVGKLSFPSVDAMEDFFTEQNKKKAAMQEQVRTSGYSSRPATSDITISVGGFDFKIHTEITKEMKHQQGDLFATAPAKMTYSCPELGIDAMPVRGNAIKNAVLDIMENVVSGKDFRERIANAENYLERNNAELEAISKRDGQPFKDAEALEKAEEKLAEYEELMKAEMAAKEAKYAEMDKDVEAAAGIELTEEDSEPTASEPISEYSAENANFVSRYETKDGKTVRYTSENPEAYGGLFDFDFSNEVPGADNAAEEGRVNRRQQSNPPLQRRNAALLDTNASARLNEANGEYCALERKFRESNYMEFTSAEKVESADDVAFIFEELENASVENVFVVMTKRGVPTVMHISIGGFNWSAMNAAPVKLAYDRIKPDKVYFVHNHPSGALNCSPQDVDCLKKVESAIGKKAEGVIMDLKSGKYGTFDSSGTGSSASHDKAPAPAAQRRLRLYAFDRHVFNPDYQPSEKMGNAQDVAKFLSSHRLGDRSKVSVLVCNNQNQIVANVHTTHVSIDSKGLADDIIRAIGEFGGMHAFLYGDFEQSGMVAYRNLSQAVKERSGGVYNLLDVVRIEGNHTWSARDNGYVYDPGSEYGASPEGDIRFREVEDDAVLKEFAEGKTVKAYRTMQVIDGKLYSPMATKVGGKTTPEIKLGVPEQAEEHPEIIKKTIINKDGNEQGIVVIDKGLGKGSLKVAYNPYVHTSRTVLNDQFSSAYKRPNLVTVEVEVPESELTSGYRADKAKNTVGEMSWHSGTVSGQLAQLGKPRRVILSRYDRPVRIVPFKEVAAMIAEQLDGTDIAIPYNVVQPQVRAELERLGVAISEEATGTVDDGDFGEAEYVTDQEVERINAHQQEMSQTSPEAKSSHAEKLAKKFNTPIQVVTDPKELTSDNAERQARMRRSKGFYDPATGKVVVILPNNANVEDVAETVFHEVVAHKGLREMIGDENYDAFCDEVYDHLKDDLKEEVDRETTRRFEREPEKGYEHHRRVSVDELFGRMAEKGFEDFTKAERGIWAKLKAKVLEVINKFLGSLKLPKWVSLGDNELRYMLWRSHEKLRTKGDYVDMARDAVKREEMGLNRWDVYREKNPKRERIEKLRKSKPVVVKDEMIPGGLDLKDRKAVKTALKAIIRETVINEDSGRSISVFKEGINEVTSHGMTVEAHVKSLFAIPEMLRKSIFIEERRNKKGHTDFDKYQYYVCGLKIDGEDYTAKIVVGVRGEDRYYDHRLSQIEKGKLIDSLNGLSNSETENEQSSGYKGTTLESLLQIKDEESFEYRFRDGETGDIWKDQSVGLQERITNAAIRLSNNQSGDLTLRNDAQKAVVNNLQSLLHSMRNRGGTAQSFIGADRKVEAGVVGAMNAQAMFDRATVKRVSDLARILMQNGYLSGMTSGEMQRLLSVVKNATAIHDISDSVQKIMDIMIGNQLRNAEGALRQLLSIRGSKVDARGVEVQGVLDVDGQRTMEVVKKAMSLSEDDITDRIAEALNRMSDPDQTIADQAALEYVGLNMALDYVQNIANSKAEEKALRDSLKTAKEDRDAGRMTDDAYKQFVEATEDAIRKNKVERAEAYFNLVGRLSDSLRESIENAKAFREAEKARVSEIHHNANSDMEGRPTNEHHKDNWKDKFVNNGFVQFLFAPLGTFDQILRVFGNKSANGEGYLWNRFMRGWVDCRNKELTGVKEKFARLDEKAAELFGKGKTWGNLIRMEAKMPKATVSFWDGGEMRDHELTQGNLLYIYMVDKMTDGRMKLRRMGITEGDIAKIENFLDPHFKALGDWLQDEFLVDTRNEYNETHKRMFGASMAAIENYFPLKILANARVDKEEDVNQQNRPDGITTKTGSIIKRRVNNLALDITGADALSVILDHITQMEHWSAYAEWNRDLNTLRTYKRFRNQVINMTTVYGGGRKLWENFNDLCLMAAGEYRPPVSKLNKSAVNLAKGVTAAKVSFRMYTALKQFLSAPAYAPEVSMRSILKSIANPYGDFKWCLENMPIFRERWHSRISGDPRLLKSDMDWKMWRNRIMEISSRIGMTPNAFVDAVTVSIGARAMYETRLKQYLKDGYPTDAAEKRAMQDATILFNQTQQSSESPFLSTMQVDKDWLSTLFTVFRNSAMSYTRQEFDAMRNLKRNLTPGQQAKSIEFMTKQILRDWDVDPDTATDAERDQAQGAAKKRFRRQIKKDVLRLATFGFILELAWNLGPYLPYMFFGNDEDEKDKMWDDAFTHAYFGSVEGLTGGDVMSSFGNMWANGEWNWNQLRKDMPLASDIITIGSKFIGGKNAEAVNDILNLLVQMGVGMNPQSITDTAIAITDACGDDPALSHEAAIFIMRVLQVPQSQIDKIYFDEVDLTGEEASKLTPAQLAQRYAEYKVKRGTPLAPWSWGDEERLVKYNDLATDRMKERLDAQGDATVIEAYADFEARYKAVSEKAKEAKELMKTDYAAAAQAHAALQQDPDIILYQRFGSLDKQLGRISKMWLTSKSPTEAALVASTISSYRAGMVKVLQAETVESQQSAMSELTTLMNDFYAKYQGMQPKQVNR